MQFAIKFKQFCQIIMLLLLIYFASKHHVARQVSAGNCIIAFLFAYNFSGPLGHTLSVFLFLINSLNKQNKTVLQIIVEKFTNIGIDLIVEEKIHL